MSFVEKAVPVCPGPESEIQRLKARWRRQQSGARAPWVATVLAHHREIDEAFAAVRVADTATARLSLLKRLTVLLTSHSTAEEGVIYPALAQAGHLDFATTAAMEQAVAKLQLGLLEYRDLMSAEFLAKLNQLEVAVKHHNYQEESS